MSINKTNLKIKKASYRITAQGEFIIENYNFAKPFANFFPGIAGKYGIPMWAFYVNRGQAISSFGTRDKDHSIMEFFPANKSWELTPSRGFRTFIKIRNNKKDIFYEPFHNGFVNLNFNLKNRMLITPYDLSIEEDNLSLGIKTHVNYFTIPNDSFAGIVRIVTLKNTGNKEINLQVLDGMPAVVPFGVANLFLKKLGRTVEAWMGVKNLKKGVPFYKLEVDPTDRPQVIHLNEGNFFLGFDFKKSRSEILKPIVDPQFIFGPNTDFSCPLEFLTVNNFSYPKNQILSSKTPCAFIYLKAKLGPEEEKKFYSVIGNMRNLKTLNSSIPKIIQPGYLEKKSLQNKDIIENLQSDVFTQSAHHEFNLYIKQTYLDNIMRGGYPEVFKSHSSKTVFYLYGRKHGDLERDYNKFYIQPAYFSQGNGNYRDLNQNRRCDNWFNPEIGEENIVSLFNLLQADGFNPLVIKGSRFIFKEGREAQNTLLEFVDRNYYDLLFPFIKKPFTPGEVILFIEENNIRLKLSNDKFLDTILSRSIRIQESEHTEGFWTDHWTYNLDLLESYLGLFPENLKEIVFTKKLFTFFDNTETVKPRRLKYSAKDGLVRQYHSLASDNAKKELIKKRENHPHIVRSQYGKGDIYSTCMINKLLCLVANKFASLDPFGVGIEMEADKPNWFDSLNGLPALLGSSLNETQELKRLIVFILDALRSTGIQKISVTEEIRDLLFALNKSTQDYDKNHHLDKDYLYWDETHSLKEDYRHKTRFGFSGKEEDMSFEELGGILKVFLNKINQGINKARDKNKNIYFSYFINEVSDYKRLEGNFVKPLKFTQKRLPLFLEAQMHALRIAKNLQAAKNIYDATKKSKLFDKKLKMYKVTAPLKAMPEEIGRCRVFTPGWLENESIWLHMEYKYLLELLKSGLHNEFYQDFKNVLIPFLNPSDYGRSTLENSSFLVSSAFADKNLHGNGFVARLSGSTAEFINIWLLMNLGLKPFFLNEKNELIFAPRPILPSWLFTKKENTYSFNFLSKVLIIYHNPKKKNTFGKNSVSPKKFIFSSNNKNEEVTSDRISLPHSLMIRSAKIQRIDIFLG